MTPARLYALLLPALVGIALFLPVLQGEFVYDDRSLLSLNPNFQEWAVIPKAFTTPYWELVDASRFSSGFYRPIGATVLAISWQFGGGEPLFFHMVSLFLHGACAMAVAALGLAIGWRPSLCAAAGLLFAASGVHAEPVAWISAIPDLLATLFCLFGLRALMLDKPKSMALCFLLAMLSKEASFGIWLLALVIAALRKQIMPVALLVVVGAVVYGLRANAFGAPSAGFDRVTTHHGLGAGDQFLLSLSLIGRYLGFLFWPWPHAPFHPLRLDEVGAAARLVPAILGGVAAVGAGLVWWWRGRRSHTLMLGLGLLFAGLVPVMNTHALGQYPFEERFLYLPSAGFLLLLAAAVDGIARRSKQAWLMPVLVLAIAVPNAYSAHVGASKWKDEETLFGWAQETSPGAMTGFIEYGRLMLERAQATTDFLQRDMYTERALDAFERSLGIDPGLYLVTSVEREKGNLGMGDALYLSGDFKAAEAVYRQTVEHYRISPMGFLGLANCRGQKAMQYLGEQHPTLADRAFKEAVGHFDTALEQSPGLLNAVIGKANALAQLRRLQEALPLAQDGFARASERFDVAQLLFSLLFQLERPAEAQAVLEEFLRLHPDHPQAFVVQQTLDSLRTLTEEAPR